MEILLVIFGMAVGAVIFYCADNLTYKPKKVKEDTEKGGTIGDMIHTDREAFQRHKDLIKLMFEVVPDVDWELIKYKENRGSVEDWVMDIANEEKRKRNLVTCLN